MGKATKKDRSYMNKAQLTEKLVTLFQMHPTDAYGIKKIFQELKLTNHPLKQLAMDILEDLAADDFIKETQPYTYILCKDGHIQQGIFRRKSNGKNTVEPIEGGDPILVAERNSMHAMDGDLVEISMMARRRNHVREAEVTKIIEAANRDFVGTLQVSRDFAFLTTENRTLANDIFIPKSGLKGGKTGDKAIVKIVEWPEHSKNPIGKVTKILGVAGDNNTEMHAILAEFGLPLEYPKNVEDAANRIPEEIPQEEIDRREDFRGVTTVTIDPRDAKDFDDALSMRKLKPGLWEVGVHIADVSHYVTENSVIDKEAVKRATSVYLVDRTIPMLPERLCNKICSLRPDEDKLTYSVIFKITEKGEVKDWHLAHTVIRSDRRFTYEEVQKLFEDRGEASPEDYKQPGDKMATLGDPNHPTTKTAEDFAEELLMLNKIAKQLRAKRFENGSINFDRCEVRFDIDEKGKPVDVFFRVSKDANKLVEEYMLLANRTVAESIGKVAKNKKPKVLPYRIHDVPDPTKLENMAAFITKFGYKLRPTGTKAEVSKNLNKLLGEIKGKKEQNLIETISLKCMMKAKYSCHNIGHYGLGFDYYTHFTSPIRRYPDLMVHRLLTRYAAGGRTASLEKYEGLCEQSSVMEQLAASAERASIKYKQVEFMSDKKDRVFAGTISGVTEFGFYVEVNENKCEGMVPLRDLDDDYYVFDEKDYCLRGRQRKHVYRLGDAVFIKVARANLERKTLDFMLVDEEGKPIVSQPKDTRPAPSISYGRKGKKKSPKKEKKGKTEGGKKKRKK
jgi:ribonuclease R